MDREGGKDVSKVNERFLRRAQLLGKEKLHRCCRNVVNIGKILKLKGPHIDDALEFFHRYVASKETIPEANSFPDMVVAIAALYLSLKANERAIPLEHLIGAYEIDCNHREGGNRSKRLEDKERQKIKEDIIKAEYMLLMTRPLEHRPVRTQKLAVREISRMKFKNEAEKKEIIRFCLFAMNDSHCTPMHLYYHPITVTYGIIYFTLRKYRYPFDGVDWAKKMCIDDMRDISDVMRSYYSRYKDAGRVNMPIGKGQTKSGVNYRIKRETKTTVTTTTTKTTTIVIEPSLKAKNDVVDAAKGQSKILNDIVVSGPKVDQRVLTRISEAAQDELNKKKTNDNTRIRFCGKRGWNSDNMRDKAEETSVRKRMK